MAVAEGATSTGWGLFSGDAQQQSADLHFRFEGTPDVRNLGDGAVVTLDGADTWVDTGEPVLPVRSSTLLLPQGMEIVDVQLVGLSQGQVIGTGTPLLAAPNAVPFDGTEADTTDWTSIFDTSFDLNDAVRYANHSMAGYSVATLNVFPILYDAGEQVLTYFDEMDLRIVTAASDSPSGPAAGDLATVEQVASAVDNPDMLATYSTTTETVSEESYEYLVITNAALADSFEPLLAHKESRGLTTRLATTEWIAANYTGTETGDLADRIRHFVADSYANHGTRWVLLGGDEEVIPSRGVYASAGGYVDNALPTDMYYACLDGPWNGDGDELWGESDDGVGGGDIDLLPEVFVGRAPVSTVAETQNFVAKTVLYESTPHPNATTALLLGEQLDANTYGSYSSIPIREQTIPGDWDVIELYDSSGTTWTTSTVVDQLNASPHLVNHLGHSNQVYNARISNSTVAALENPFPYFIYSQGCDAGSFDTHDISIGEQHVIGQYGAFGAVMNSRYGWYVPGTTPGGSHYYAMEFFDAVFNENKIRAGEANFDSKVDNLFRVTGSGAYRWIHFETNLLGDPETPLQIGDAIPSSGTISGHVYDDLNGNGQLDPGETGKAGEIVYLDLNGDGNRDQGSRIIESRDTPKALVDAGTITSTIDVSGIGRVQDVNVKLNISHTYVSDLVVTLIAPDGTRVELFSRVGGEGDNFINTVLDDQGDLPIGAGWAPFTGSFRPSQPLSTLEGKAADGQWTLEIEDTLAWDTGTLESWSLEFTNEEPVAISGDDGSYAFENLPAGEYTVRHETTGGTQDMGATAAGATVELATGQTVTGVDFYNTSNAIEVVDLGTIDYRLLDDAAADGSTWYRIQAAHDGMLSVLASGGTAQGSVVLRDASGRMLTASTLDGNEPRLDWNVQAGDAMYLELSGGTVVDAQIANLVNRSSQGLELFGTEGNDVLEVTVGEQIAVTINGLNYSFGADEFTAAPQITFDGGRGEDAAQIVLQSGDHTARLAPGELQLQGEEAGVTLAGTEAITLIGGGGLDVASLFDSAGDDVLIARPEQTTLSGDGFTLTVEGFDYTHAYATGGGIDVAHLLDSAGNDQFTATPEYGIMRGAGFYNRAKFFDYTHGYHSGGDDLALLSGSAGADELAFRPEYSVLSGDGFYLRAKHFGDVVVRGGGGADAAQLDGSAGVDWLVARPGLTTFEGAGFSGSFSGFADVTARGGTGDVALIFDTPGDDVFVAQPGEARMTGPGYSVAAYQFEYAHGIANSGGTDVAHLYDSAGDDVFVGRPEWSTLSGDGFFLRAKYFDYVHGYANSGGNDTARLYDSAGVDDVVVRQQQTVMRGSGFYNRVKLFDHIHAFSESGNDRARIVDSAGDDQLKASGDHVQMQYPEVLAELYGFASLQADSSNGGDDTQTTADAELALALTGGWLDVA